MRNDGPPHTAAQLRKLVANYIKAVESGKRVVGRRESLAVRRHQQDLKRRSRKLRFNEARALRVLRFAERFVRHTKPKEWRGRPFRFTPDSAWEAFILWTLFGWERKDSTGVWVRRFSEAYISVARKNGKTMLAAIVALYLFAADGEAGPEIYFGATQKEQAAIGWKMTAAIVRASPDLRKAVRVWPTRYRMALEADFYDSTCCALSRNDDEFDGFNPNGAILDEVHAYADGGIYDVLTSGMGTRSQPLAFLITTRGANPSGFCGAYDRTAEQILEGLVEDDGTFVFIAALDDGDDWKDPGVWAKANPNIGVSVRVDYLRDRMRKAINDPVKLNEFLRKHMNRWTVGSKGWGKLTLDKWDACNGDVDLAALAHARAFCGVDLSKRYDYTAAVLVFPRADGTFDIVPRFWIPEAMLEERAKREKIPVRAWADAGLLTVCPGEVIDQNMPKEQILAWHREYELAEVPYDAAQAWKLASELVNEGVNAVEFSQSWAVAHAAQSEVEALIADGRVRHGGNPILRWMFSNVETKENSTGLVRLCKRTSPDRIDGVMAMIMALARAVTHERVAPAVHVVG